MKTLQRAAVNRILVDLIKADMVIDMREMKLYRELKRIYKIGEKECEMSATMTLADSLDAIRSVPPVDKAELLESFREMASTDGFCAREEALMLIALEECLRNGDDEPEAEILSVEVDEHLIDSRQAIYVESNHNMKVNRQISLHKRAISNEWSLCGFDFVYIPDIAHHFNMTDPELLTSVVSMLSPTMSTREASNIADRIRSLLTETFTKEQLVRKLKFNRLADTRPAILLRVNMSRIKDRVVSNFLKIETGDNPLALATRFNNRLNRLSNNETLRIIRKDDSGDSFLYTGFYRQIFDILMLRRSIRCHLLIDVVAGKLSFVEIGVTLTGMRRKERALYQLFVNHIHDHGISFTPPYDLAAHERFVRRLDALMQEYATIYESFGGDPGRVPDITRPDIRLPMITTIRKTILQYSDQLLDAERFIISRDKETGRYEITASLSSFMLRDFNHPEPVPYSSIE